MSDAGKSQASGAPSTPAGANRQAPPVDASIPSTNLLNAFGRWLRDYFNLANFNERLSTKVVFGVGVLAFIALKFVIVPTVASRAVDVIAEGYDIDMEVGGWSAGLLDLSASAQDVAVRVPGRYAQSELLTIDELELDLSLWSRIRGKSWVNEVRIKGPRLYMERQLDGAWNWHDLGIFSPADTASFPIETDRGPGDSLGQREIRTASASERRDHAPSSILENKIFDLRRLRIEDMRLEWVENLPGNSGGGLINDQRATLFLDDMEISAQDLVGLLDPRPQPTRLNINARTADGKISMTGQANFFNWSQDTPRAGAESAASSRLVWSPTFNISLYLENVGAGAFARLTPEVAIRPARGTMTGTVELALNNYELECRANVELRDVTFAVNRASPLLARRGDEVESEVASLRPVSGRYQFDCGGLGTDEGFRPVQAFQSRITREALSQAPKTVRATVAADHTRYTSEPLSAEYRSTVASMTYGVDPELLKWMGTVNAVSRKLPSFLDRIGLPRGLPGGRP